MLSTTLLMMLAAAPERKPIADILASGRCLGIAETPSQRISLAPRVPPGQPPALGFRWMEGRMKHRYADLGLVLDDAGH